MDSSGLGMILGRYKLCRQKAAKSWPPALIPGQADFELAGLENRFLSLAVSRMR